MDYRHGLGSHESRDPIGSAVAALNRLAQSGLLDRVGLRKQAERAVIAVTRTGFRGLAGPWGFHHVLVVNPHLPC